MIFRFKILNNLKILLIFIVLINLFSVLSVAASNPKAIEALNEGVIFYSEGNFKQAILQCNIAIDIDPNFFEAFACKGESLMLIGNYTEALESFDRALEIKNDSAEIWLIRGYTLSELSRYNEALENYNESIRLNNQSKKAWYNKANTLRILGDYEEALQAYDIALSIDWNYSKVWYNKGKTFQIIGRYEEALSSYYNATLINPNYTEAWYNHGYTLTQLGRYQESLDSYSKAINLDSNDIKSYIGTGNSLAFLGRYDEAIKTYDEALNISPYNSLVWYNKGNALYLMKNYSAAKDSNQKAIQFLWNDTKKINIDAQFEFDSDLINDQIGVVGKTYPFIVEIIANEDVDLFNNIYIEFNKNSRQIELNNSNEILIDVIIDEKDYWGPLVYNLERELEKEILLEGQSDSFKVNVTFLSPGVYILFITTDERSVPIVIQIVDPLTMRDLENEVTSLQVAEDSKKIAKDGNRIAIFAVIIAVFIGPFVTYILTKRWKEQNEKSEYVNKIQTKLDQIENTRSTWMKEKNYNQIKDNFVIISDELVSIISKAPANFSGDILNDLRALYQSLNVLSSYSMKMGEDSDFEEITQTIITKVESIDDKLKSIK